MAELGLALVCGLGMCVVVFIIHGKEIVQDKSYCKLFYSSLILCSYACQVTFQ